MPPDAAPAERGSESVLAAIERLTGEAPRVTLRDTPSLDGEGEASPAPDAAASSPAAPLAGRSSHYRVLGEIARGGMGVVLRGRDDDLGRDVALKVLHGDLTRRHEVVQRFVEEAQIGGQLQHPGIVPVYELGLMADQRPYFAMKLVKGRTLAALLADGAALAPDRRRLIAVFEAVCQTMAYAHSRGVVHRDLKPTNVMVGAFGEVQVVDWGLSKVLVPGGAPSAPSSPGAASSVIRTVRSEPGADSSRSLAGSVFGTPAYMPPEQARGEIERLDERSDVFSLGAMLCEILTGSPPYTGAHVLDQAARAELGPALARLSASGAEEELLALCRDCLAPAPTARPRTAEVVAERVHAHLASVEERAQLARIEAAEARVAAAAERRARRLTLALAASVLLTVGIAGGGWAWRERERRAELAENERAVHAALSEATLARGREDWDAAAAAATRADALAQSRPAADELRARVAAEVAETARGAESARAAAETVRENERLLAGLDDVRQPEGHVAYPTDWALLDASYAALFEGLGLFPDRPDAAAAAEELRRRGLDGDIAVALDEWSIVRYRGALLEGAERLRRVADLLDPDPLRLELRQVMATNDVARGVELAREADAFSQPSVTLRLLGRALHLAEQHDEAEAFLLRARLAHPGDFLLALDAARLIRGKVPGGLEQSLPHYAAALALRPSSLEAWHETGRLLQELPGRQQQALEHFQAALARRPDDGHLHFHVGASLERLGRTGEAVAAYRRSIELDPGFALTHNNLGNALLRRGETGAARECFERAIEVDPALAIAHASLGTQMLRSGELEQAAAALERAVALDPELAWGRARLGGLRLLQGREADAQAEFARARKSDANQASVRGQIAMALADAGRRGEAIEEFRRALELAPDDVALLNDLGTELRRNGEPEKALDCYRRALELAPGHAVLHNSRGRALQDLRRLDEAVAAYRRALELDPAMVVTRRNLGVALNALKRHEEAIAEFRALVEAAPDASETHFDLASALSNAGRREEAVESYRRALELKPDSAANHNDFGVFLVGMGRIDEGIEHYRRALALAPDLVQPQGNLGYALAFQGRFAEALPELRRAAEMGTKEPWVLNMLAWILCANADPALRDPLEAVRVARRTLELTPEDPNAWNTLGVALYRAGEHEECVRALERVQELGSKSPPHDWLFLAMAHHRLGNAGAARESFRRAEEWLASHPADEELARFRAEALELLAPDGSAR